MKQLSILNIILLGKSRLKFVVLFLGVVASCLISALVYQIYSDFAYLYQRGSGDAQYQYLQINKEIGLSNTFGVSNTNFTEEDIDFIANQPFIEDVAPLYQNNYRVLGSFAGNRFDMFFNAIKSDFLDVDLDDFSWKNGDDVVPIVVANDFVKIMNHAVLPSQGKPPIPKFAMEQIVVDLRLMNNGRELNVKAQIVGFSDRVSSVIVPKTFLDYSNKYLSGKAKGDVAMLLLKVKDSGSPQLKKFLNKNGLEVNEEKLIATSRKIVTIIISVLFLLGLVIFILSNSLIVAQIHWLMAENKDRIGMLKLLGYNNKKVIWGIFKPSIYFYLISLVVSVGIFLGVTFLMHSVIKSLQLGYPQISILSVLIPVFIIVTVVLRLSLIHI